MGEQDTGYAYGISYGGTEERGDWQVGYSYQKLEADAVFGAFTDSDFAGGGTDNRGHQVSAAIALNGKAKLQLTYFDTDTGLYSSDEDVRYRRAFLDLIFDY
ncbi:MAG: putative porin [Woeseiaceae bacterium]